MTQLRDAIETWLASTYPDSELLRVWPLGGGISSQMTAFRFTHHDEERTLLLRQPNDWTLENVPHAVPREFKRLQTLHRGGIAVQSPVFCDESGSQFGRPALVLEFIEGRPDLSPVNLASTVEQFADRLAEIHRFDATNEDLALQETGTPGFEQYANEAMPQADPVFQVERIWKTLASHSDKRSLNKPVLLHGDFWPGNTLWQDGSLVAVIDWEEATRGDPLSDLSISRLDLWWAFGQSAMETLTHSYLALNPVDPTLLPLWDLRTALRPVTNLPAWADAYKPLDRPDITLESMQIIHTEFVAQAFEALQQSSL